MKYLVGTKLMKKITQADSSLCAFIPGGFTKMKELENADAVKLFSDENECGDDVFVWFYESE